MFGSTIDNAISDFFYRPFTRTYKPGDPHTLPIMGITVAQEQYDALKTDFEREQKSAQHWYAKYMKVDSELRERLAKRDELITKLANDLQDANNAMDALSKELEQERRSSFLLRQQALEANETIEKMSIEIDTLQKQLAKYKQSTRETGVRP